MRTLNQLYVILLTHWQEMGNGFICVAIDNLEKREKINDREHLALMRHFQSQNPDKTQHTEFTLHESWYGSHAWWVRDEVGQRELFLQKMIELTDTRTPLQRLAETIEQENETFDSLTRPEKRVKIAKDCLLRIKLKNIKPKEGIVVKISITDNFAYTPEWGVPLKPLLNSEESPYECRACAKGSLFMSYIGRVNKSVYNADLCSTSVYSEVHTKLFEVFTPLQVALIEYAFERYQYISTYNGESIDFSERTRTRARNFYDRYENVTERMAAICENIIKNKGTFKL